MRIAFLVNEFPSLSETFVLNQIAGLVQEGLHVDIYARNAQATDKVHPLVEEHQLIDQTYYYPYLPANYFIRYLKALWLVLTHMWLAPRAILSALNFKKYGRHASSLRLLYRSVAFIRAGCPSYDVIMCHFGPTGLVALDLKDIGVLGGHVCVAFHGLDLSAHLLEAGKDVYAPLFAKADLLLPISQFWQKRLIELGGDPQKIQVHRMGIDVEQFVFQARELPKGHPVRVISVARLVEKKGIEYGIRAFQEVVHHYPDVEYVVVGDGPLMSELSTLVQTLKLEDKVQLRGWQQQKDVIKLLDSAHMMLVPSVTSSNGDMEGIPVVLMEAMAMGLPVISTLHSGIPELVSQGETGLLVPERNVSELAAQILKLIQQSETWPKMGHAAREKVTQEYEIKRLNHQLIASFSALQAEQKELK